MVLMCFFVASLLVSFSSYTLALFVTFEPHRPALGDDVVISCRSTGQQTSTITWSVDSSVLTTCNGGTCYPSPTGYTYSNDVTNNVFNLSLASVALTDCKTYTCTDTTKPALTNSGMLFISKYDSRETVLRDPGTNSSGIISVTTGCVLSLSDMTVEWKIVKQNGVLINLEPTLYTETRECTAMCHSQTSEKVTSYFYHTEYTGSDFERIKYMAVVRHNSYSAEIKYSATLKIKNSGIATATPFEGLNGNRGNEFAERYTDTGTCLTLQALYLFPVLFSVVL